MPQILGIRDLGVLDYERTWLAMQRFTDQRKHTPDTQDEVWLCLLYTSDAADE